MIIWFNSNGRNKSLAQLMLGARSKIMGGCYKLSATAGNQGVKSSQQDAYQKWENLFTLACSAVWVTVEPDHTVNSYSTWPWMIQWITWIMDNAPQMCYRSLSWAVETTNLGTENKEAVASNFQYTSINMCYEASGDAESKPLKRTPKHRSLLTMQFAEVI